MAGLCEGGNEPPGSLKASKTSSRATNWCNKTYIGTSNTRRNFKVEIEESSKQATDRCLPRLSSSERRINMRTAKQSVGRERISAERKTLELRAVPAVTCGFGNTGFRRVKGEWGSSHGLADEEDKESYDKIEEIVEKEKKGACIILMGAWNVVLEEGQDGRTVEKYEFGRKNDRGESLFKVCHGSLYAVMWLVDTPKEFNRSTLPQRCITYVPKKLPSKYGVHSEEYLPIHTVTPVVAGIWLFNDAVSTTRLFSVGEIGDSEMVFGEMSPRIRHRLPGIHLTVRKNLGKNPTRRLRWAGHVGRMGVSRNAYRVLIGRPEGIRPLGKPRRRWEDNIKMDLREVGYDDRDWINLTQNRTNDRLM
ncbi:hypothetical protein ANN_15488 [Periplaneta americana]|uniref:Uncharacterized protein n=1 Tax=Periplaneta americana TaxID=6978 RepID=A0ABQ8SIE8_PERAM|nr:hypothetical protein ANN_15488 [Periplaneta americana]